ncbi:MAG TPA: hypothetical protein VFT65_05495 [Candidatus Angelobacter sp.]|nr:hypothetical protein [Candidatus Angelobacter sp.]
MSIRTSALEVVSTVEVAAPCDPFLTLPVRCASDRTIFVRMADTSGISDLVSISSDGTNVIRFSSNKINDVLNPKTCAFFVSQSDVYMLASGSTPQEHSLRVKKPNGDSEEQRMAAIQEFIVRFGRDGSYRGAVRLDLPFTPYQVGVFPGGDFLLAGATPDNQVRLALVKSNGQFQRYVELEGDIQLESQVSTPEEKSGHVALPMNGKRFGEGFQDVVRVSLIVADGPRLLLLRKVAGAPIFSISAGGDVRTVTPKVPKGYSLADLKTTPNEWIISYTHRISDTAGVAFETYALNPASGEIIQGYSFPRLLGLGMACADGLEFSFLTREEEKLKIVNLLSTNRSSSQNHPRD